MVFSPPEGPLQMCDHHTHTHLPTGHRDHGETGVLLGAWHPGYHSELSLLGQMSIKMSKIYILSWGNGG